MQWYVIIIIFKQQYVLWSLTGETGNTGYIPLHTWFCLVVFRSEWPKSALKEKWSACADVKSGNGKENRRDENERNAWEKGNENGKKKGNWKHFIGDFLGYDINLLLQLSISPGFFRLWYLIYYSNFSTKLFCLEDRQILVTYPATS